MNGPASLLHSWRLVLLQQNCVNFAELYAHHWLGPVVVVVVPWRILALQRCFWLMQSILAIRWLWQLLRDCRQSFHQSYTLLLYLDYWLLTSLLFLQLGAVPLFLEDLKRCKVRGCFWLMQSILAIRWLWHLLRDRGQIFFTKLQIAFITCECKQSRIYTSCKTNLFWYRNFILSITEVCYTLSHAMNWETYSHPMLFQLLYGLSDDLYI